MAEELNTIEEATTSVVETTKKFNGKALGLGLAIAGTCGLILLAVKLVKRAKAKKAQKVESDVVPEPVENEKANSEEEA